MTVKEMIRTAYVLFADGRLNPFPAVSVAIEGGPSWIDSERYEVDAKAEGAAGQETMRGPMMQRLLEERFHLEIRRETREVPVYALTVSKGGHKPRPPSGGSCGSAIEFFTKSFPPPEAPPGQKFCRVEHTEKGGVVTEDLQSSTLDDFCRIVLKQLDRPVVNRTGLDGRFDFRLEYASDEYTGPSRGGADVGLEPSGFSIFSSIQQQLGLRLEAARGPGEFLVIGRVERPSEN